MTYQIILPQFEGPFDLLLFFIERDELDIYDIPIHKITQDFLQYIQHLERMNMDVASEFILVAASLMRIKAKMLIPRKELDESGNEIDPREELVARLIEYKKYKDVVEDLEKLEDIRIARQKRGNINQDLKNIASVTSVDAELESLSLYKLMLVYQRVISRFDKSNETFQHTIVKYNYTIQSEKKRILEWVFKKKKVTFEDILRKSENRMHVVFSFLALLEMIQSGDIFLQVREGYNNFTLSVL